MATAEAKAAVMAAKNRRKWGAYAALRYVRNRGVSMSMYVTALLFEARRGYRVAV